MKLQKQIILYFFFVLYSCGAGWSDLLLDMGNNYHYYGEGSPSNYIFYGIKDRRGTSIDKEIIYPNVEAFGYDDTFILVLQKPSLEEVGYLVGSELNGIARVFKYVDSLSFEKSEKEIQEKYLQHIKDSLFYRKIGLKITPRNTIEEQRFFWNLGDSIVKTDLKYKKIFANEFNYWIINKETDEIFGPFSKEEYLKKKQELGVSKKLKLPSIEK